MVAPRIGMEKGWARAAAVASSRPAPKFQPRAISKVDRIVPVIDGGETMLSAPSMPQRNMERTLTRAPCLPPLGFAVIPKRAPILIIQDPWVSLILDGHKTFEVRGTPCKKSAGEKIYLALSGGGGIVVGEATFVACHGPLSKAQFKDAAD